MSLRPTPCFILHEVEYFFNPISNEPDSRLQEISWDYSEDELAKELERQKSLNPNVEYLIHEGTIYE